MSDYESSDEAPEAVSFTTSKSEAIEKFQLASKAAKEEKLKLKEKRKKREEVFKAQKEQKLARYNFIFFQRVVYYGKGMSRLRYWCGVIFGVFNLEIDMSESRFKHGWEARVNGIVPIL